MKPLRLPPHMLLQLTLRLPLRLPCCRHLPRVDHGAEEDAVLSLLLLIIDIDTMTTTDVTMNTT